MLALLGRLCNGSIVHSICGPFVVAVEQESTISEVSPTWRDRSRSRPIRTIERSGAEVWGGSEAALAGFRTVVAGRQRGTGDIYLDRGHSEAVAPKGAPTTASNPKKPGLLGCLSGQDVPPYVHALRGMIGHSNRCEQPPFRILVDGI